MTLKRLIKFVVLGYVDTHLKYVYEMLRGDFMEDWVLLFTDLSGAIACQDATFETEPLCLKI